MSIWHENTAPLAKSMQSSKNILVYSGTILEEFYTGHRNNEQHSGRHLKSLLILGGIDPCIMLSKWNRFQAGTLMACKKSGTCTSVHIKFTKQSYITHIYNNYESRLDRSQPCILRKKNFKKAKVICSHLFCYQMGMICIECVS